MFILKHKLFIILLVFCLLFTGCNNGKKTNVPSRNSNSTGKSLVLYFSATGTTEKIAKRIADLSNSDIVEIVPKEKYKSEDLNYNQDCRANREQNDSQARPAIQNSIDIQSYDVIYLGYPIWWGTNPKIILTLLDSYDFSGKMIVPFCTSGSTDIHNSVEDLRSHYPNYRFLDGKRFSTSDSDDEIKEFLIPMEEVIDTMKVTINEKEYFVSLADNETTKSLILMLPLELSMFDLNGNEKYANLDQSLPTNEYSPNHIEAGDVMLFGDNCLVIFYQSFDTSYRYTRIGHIDRLDDLGSQSIKAIFEK